jgi:hypothetical protein
MLIRFNVLPPRLTLRPTRQGKTSLFTIIDFRTRLFSVDCKIIFSGLPDFGGGSPVFRENSIPSANV